MARRSPRRPIYGSRKTAARRRSPSPAPRARATVSRLLHHILRKAGRDAALLGNVGVAALGQTAGRDHTVLELSSYQIADLAHAPSVAIVTNLYVDHVPWHGSVERYHRDKLRADRRYGDAGGPQLRQRGPARQRWQPRQHALVQSSGRFPCSRRQALFPRRRRRHQRLSSARRAQSRKPRRRLRRRRHSRNCVSAPARRHSRLRAIAPSPGGIPRWQWRALRQRFDFHRSRGDKGRARRLCRYSVRPDSRRRRPRPGPCRPARLSETQRRLCAYPAARHRPPYRR